MSGEENKRIVKEEVRMTARTSFSGPLPSPETLQSYNLILPGLADRIVRMAEGQSGHRQKLESLVIWFDGIRATLGVIFGFLIAITGIGAGTWLIYSGFNIYGLVSLFAPLAVIVGAFVYRKREEAAEKEK